jgi:hypothetical protein
MRALKFFLSCLAAVAFTGCTSYHLGAVNGAVPGDKSIEVLPFNNQTLQPRLGDALTQALRERLQVDGTYHLATHGAGDVIVTGVIHFYARESLGASSTDVFTPDDYRVGATVHVTVRESISGKLLLDKEVKGHALVSIGSDLASAERQALPVLAADLANNIAEQLTEGAW